MRRTERTFSTDRELAETDRNSNVQIARNYFPRRTIRHVDGVHELCAQTEINQGDGRVSSGVTRLCSNSLV